MTTIDTGGGDPELQSLKWQALKELAAGAGHEINNPLATIVGRAQMLLKAEHDPVRRQWLGTMISQAYRIRDMIGDLMIIANPPEPVLETFDLQSALVEVRDQLVSSLGQALITIDCCQHAVSDPGVMHDVSESQPQSLRLPIRTDRSQFKIVLNELFRNALQSAGEHARISVHIEKRPPKGYLIEVADNGPGLSAEHLEHLFDPFFSGRQAGRGLGFGLPKCRRIVELHEGRIEVQNRAEGGVKVSLWWPDALEN